MKGIILIGFMGSGKTTVGKLLAEKTGMQHVDFDEQLVIELGMTIQEYFDLYGEKAFRDQETKLLKRYIDHEQIISTGGGIVLKPENRQLLKQLAPVIYLKTEPETFLSRLKEDQENVRPLIISKTAEEIQEIFEPRIPFYEESASLIIPTSDRTPESIVQEILEKI
ncbi:MULTISPECIES: shikimate kinase [unclassified Enterococcus]|uniref:shikimate kinase n=1 Tax=unclassified Enterococcus TaxID=2608891 RepID=UPI001CE14B2A|nr:MULTISPECIES: shikimate kinase [unclassified Enterococcus]MCA5012839.1 shikimate kinase [Enterococcus sp. S23]MCA5016090.1 shikimate kinase [Enterococcus sp. S22(2020)]